MSKDAVIIICTRPESSRLPGKVFKKIAGLPAIEHILKRLDGINTPIVLAVPYLCHVYDHLKCTYPKIMLYKGNAESPLHRMADALSYLELKESWVIRITHDDILIDQQTILNMLQECQTTPGCGYGISPDIVEGAGVEVIHRENLIKAAKDRLEPTEFVSYFVKDNVYKKQVHYKPRKEICRPYRLTMDYAEDAVVLETILRAVGPLAPLDTICEFLDIHPYVLRINDLPRISLYTCAYNAGKYIERAMASVLSHHQTSSYEYIVIDDASTDNTLLAASQYGYDNRLRYYVNETNKGLADSSNFAISKAKGSYIMRIDADDFLLSYALKDMLNIMESDHDIAVVYPAYKEINEKEEIISQIIDPRIYHHAGCALMDKRVLNEIRFTKGLKHWDSKDLYNRIHGQFKIAYTNEPLWLYRKHAASLSANNTKERLAVLQTLSN